MAFSESFLEELSARNDIVDVVSGYVPLTKRSGANQFGLCPFHSEKTPSFSVNPERQIYHCFGCGKGGGVINFIMEIENLSFPDAVEFLASRSGMQLPQEGPDENRSRRTRMLELNREAARWFHGQLTSPSGRPAQEYIEKRGIGGMVRPFGLGYAPDSWSSLLDSMRRLGYSEAELISAGLARAGKKGGAYDYFRNRLIFPVIDVRGSVIGFSGRILDDGEPKYLNSPDTPVYSKSRSLFALNLAKKSKSGYILLAEGNIDVVSLHQAGFDSAVASLGTALTPDQARLLSRYTKQLVICYDNDAAGQKAAQRAIGILQPLDLQVKVLQITGAKDPDEFIQTRGAAAFRELISGSDNEIEYRLSRIASENDLETLEGRQTYAREAVRLIASLPNAVDRDLYGARAAEKAGVRQEAFRDDVAHFRKRSLASARKRQERTDTSPLRAIQPQSRELRFSNPRSASAEKGIINLLYRFPEQFKSLSLSGDLFSSEPLGRLFDSLLEQLKNDRTISVPALSEQFSSDEMSLLTDIISHDEVTPTAAEAAMKDYIRTIQEEHDRSSDPNDLRSYAEHLKKRKGYSKTNGS